MKKIITCILAIFTGYIFPVDKSIAADGNTAIAKWKNNKKGAFSLRFDDSMMSHRDHTIPNLIKRGLTASFFINPATNRYGYGIDTWESLAGRAGMELCPHTMNHTGAADFEEADYEIGQAFAVVWSLNPPDKSKLYPFASGGGTTWPDGYRETILKKYPTANFQSEAVRYQGADNRNELISFAKKAISDGTWHYILTHGTGPNLEWLGFEVTNFEALLDYLASVKEQLWIGNVGNIYKYVIERKSAKVTVTENSNTNIRLNLTSAVDPELYDYPLTLISEVSPSWNYCKVSQGNLQHIYPVKDGKVMYEALPNRGEIVLRSSPMDTTPPEKITVRDGTAQDINESSFTTNVSANWDNAVDPESGITRYWYKIGTTPGGSEVLDWIDNGLSRSFTTSMTNFSLIRGDKYYVSVKAVNGVGLSSESTSNGFVVNMNPGYLSFQDNFDNGYLSQWDEKHTRIGSEKNLIYISEQAARTGKYGMQCHLGENENGEPFIASHDVTEFEDLFTRFYFKISKDFTIPEGNGSLQLLELKDASGNFVAGVFVGYLEGIGLHVFCLSLDNTGYRTSLPGNSGRYPLSFVPLQEDQWHRIDIRTVANDGKGVTEFWFDGERKGCIKNRFTAGMVVKSLYIGAISVPGKKTSGDIFYDDITVSDSMLK